MPFPSSPAAYILTDVLTGVFYIGSTGNLRSRMYSHRSALERGSHDNSNLQSIYSGWNNIKIEYYPCASLDAARRKEASLLRFSRHDSDLANIGTGAYSLWGDGMPDEYRERIRITSREYASRPENRERIRQMNLNRSRDQVLASMAKARAAQGPISEETRRKMSEAWHRNGGISQETRQKMNLARARREMHFSPTARARQLEACQKSIMIEGIRYPSIASAARALGLGESTIAYRIRSENRPDWNYISGD